MVDLDVLAKGLTDGERECVSTARLYVSGKWRVHYKYAGPVMRALWAKSLMDVDSSYLNDLGLALRAHLKDIQDG